MDMTESGWRTRIGGLSLIAGPALMSIGDLFHPPEDWDPVAQVSVLADRADHWYFTHLLLFIGMLLFVPGILEITRWAATRRPRAGFAARILLLASVGALSAVFSFEMLLGQFIAQGAAQSDALAVLETFQSPAVFFVLLPGLLAFFVGTGLAVLALSRPADPCRWPAVLLGIGAAFILGEIILAQVLLSQIGNVLILAAGVGFAHLIRRERDLGVAV